MELLKRIAGTSIGPGYNPWTYVDFCDSDEYLMELLKYYKEIRVAAAVSEDTSDVLKCFRYSKLSASLVSKN